MPKFDGAKIAILAGDKIVTILRDDRPDIAWPGHWDLPGGGREGRETPAETVLRELDEELGLRLNAHALLYAREYQSGDSSVWFFAVEWPDLDETTITFGDEGQEWCLMPIADFTSHHRAIPALQSRVLHYLETVR